jgi:hypothetical protein
VNTEQRPLSRLQSLSLSLSPSAEQLYLTRLRLEAVFELRRIDAHGKDSNRYIRAFVGLRKYIRIYRYFCISTYSR